MTRSTPIYAAFIALAVNAPVWAQSDNSSDSAQPQGSQILTKKLVPVQVTSGVPAPGDPLLQATQVDVLTGPEKDREEGASLGGTLEALPGVDNLSAGSQTGKPVIRGLSGNRVRILSGGMGLDHQQYGTRHSPNLDPFLSGRIEVVRGASSLLYGSDALGGAVNVMPLEIPFAPEGEAQWGGDTLTRYSSNNEQWDLGVKARSGTSRFGVVFGVIDHSAGNLTTPDEPTFAESGNSGDPKFTGELDHTDFDQTNAVLGVGSRGSWGEVQAHYTRWRSEQNFLLPTGKGIGQDLEDDRLRLAGTFPLASGWELRPKLMWQNNRRRANAPGKPRTELFDGTIDLDFNQYTGRLEAEHGPWLGLDYGTLGAELVRKEQESRGTTQLSPGGDVTKAGLFANEERGFGPWTVQGGLRYDHIEVMGDEGETASVESEALKGEGRTGERYDVVTGSLGASYRFTPHLTLAANAARGFRAPTLFELYAHGVHGGVVADQRGNPDLDPERSIDTDLALRWRSPQLQASATVYRNQIDDYIFLRDTGKSTDDDDNNPIFRYNQADAVLTGLDLEAKGEPISWLALAASASFVEGENTDTNEDLPLLPANKLRASVTYQPQVGGKVTDPYVELGIRHALAKDAAPGEPFEQFDDKPFGTASTDAYTLLDLSAGFRWQGPLTQPVKVDLEVRNLLDEEYRDFLDTYKGYALSPGRNILATVRIPFGAT